MKTIRCPNCASRHLVPKGAEPAAHRCEPLAPTIRCALCPDWDRPLLGDETDGLLSAIVAVHGMRVGHQG